MALTYEGTVTASEGGIYEIVTKSGEHLSCKPRGKFRHERIRLLVGDRVSVCEDENRNFCVDVIHERKNALLRPPLANLDRLFVVIAAAEPDPVLLNADKMTSIAEHNHIKPVIVISKSDLAKQRAMQLKKLYEQVGYRAFLTSSSDKKGIEELKEFLCQECTEDISAFAGVSGAGKSTLLNCLFEGLDRETGAVSKKIGRGKHTTRAVTLFENKKLLGKGEGFLADTPGFSLLDFENFDFFALKDLPHNFPEFEPWLGTCHYTKCTHRKEEGCSILRLVSEGRIPRSRQESYTVLYEQLKNKHSWEK